MFEWRHEFSTEVDLPLQQVWNFYANPSNWPRWIDQLESCEGELKIGSIIQGKIKNRSAYLPIKITDVEPFKTCTHLIKNLLFIQTSSISFQVTSSKKTTLTIKVSVVGLLVPFLKNSLTSRTEDSSVKSVEALLEFTKENVLP